MYRAVWMSTCASTAASTTSSLENVVCAPLHLQGRLLQTGVPSRPAKYTEGQLLHTTARQEALMAPHSMRWLCRPAHTVHSHQHHLCCCAHPQWVSPTMACQVMQGRQGLLGHIWAKTPKMSVHVSRSVLQQTSDQEGMGKKVFLEPAALLNERVCCGTKFVESSQMTCLSRARHARICMAFLGRWGRQAVKRTCTGAGWGIG